MSSLLSVSEASKLLGVCENTLREWDDNASFKAYRTTGGHRRYDLDDIRKYLDEQMPEKEHNDLERVSNKDIPLTDLLYQKWEQYLNINISEEHKRALAVMIDNEKLHNDLISDPVFAFEQIVWLLQQVFLRSSFLKMVKIQPLAGPTGLVFYNSPANKNTIKIESAAVIAKIRTSAFTLYNRPFDEMKEAYADSLAKDIDNEIFEHLCDVYSCDAEAVLNARKQLDSPLSDNFDYIIASKEIIQKLQKIDDTIDYFIVDTILDEKSLAPLSCAGKYPENFYSLPIFAPYFLIGIVAPKSLNQFPKLLRRTAWFTGK